MAALEPIARTFVIAFTAATLTVAMHGCVSDPGPIDSGDARPMAAGCNRDFTSDNLCPPAHPKFYFCSPPATPGTSAQCVVHRDRMGAFSEWCCITPTP